MEPTFWQSTRRELLDILKAAIGAAVIAFVSSILAHLQAPLPEHIMAIGTVVGAWGGVKLGRA